MEAYGVDRKKAFVFLKLLTKEEPEGRKIS